MKEIPKWVLGSLCYYDRKNPESGFIDDEDKVDKAKNGCSCDNCFYGRTKLAEEIIKLYNERNPN